VELASIERGGRGKGTAVSGVVSSGTSYTLALIWQVNALKGASVVTGESHFLEETMNPSRVRQYLSNPKEQEKAKGMKWLLAMISKGTPCHEFFPDVVKCVVCKQVITDRIFRASSASRK
jgi:hypothetical protein